MIDRPAEWVAAAAAGRLVGGDPATDGPARAIVDSRAAGPGDLFFGLPGRRSDGGAFAAAALDAGAWGAVVAAAHAESLAEERPEAVVIAARAPAESLAALARAWRRELDCPAVGVTGSTGKTSTKDILAALLSPSLRTHANRENLNTEIGLPLSLLEAERGTEVLVLEMAMRGAGQIAELAAIAEPSAGVIVNVGPVHLELVETLRGVAAAKAELIRDLPTGAPCIVPMGEPLLEEHLRDDLDTITFGPGGDVSLRSFEGGRAEIEARGRTVSLDLAYDQPYNVVNTVAAAAAALALGVEPEGHVEPRFSALRGEVVELAGGVRVLNDCYNANPMSMRAALEHLAATVGGGRRIALLGGMGELGADSDRFHREIGERADELGIEILVTVGDLGVGYAPGFRGETHAVATPEEAGVLLDELSQPGDRVLIKGSRSVGLERVLGEPAEPESGG